MFEKVGADAAKTAGVQLALDIVDLTAGINSLLDRFDGATLQASVTVTLNLKPWMPKPPSGTSPAS